MTDQREPFQIDVLDPTAPAEWAGMTFPAYRHLLALQPTKRLPSEPEQRLIQPIALVARMAAGEPAGLAVAELPLDAGDGPAELLSVFVGADHRGQGLATALLDAMEETLRAAGADAVEASYTTGTASTDAVERLFATRGWAPPEMRTLIMRFTIAEALSTPWYGRMGLLPKGGEIFSWKDLTAAERQHIFDSNQRKPWIPNGLQPWRHDHGGFDPISSLGLRYRGEVVGWVINHQVDPVTVRFTCSFMRKDLSRRARIVPLYSEALRRLSLTTCEKCTMVTPTVFPGMNEFVRRHCAPYVSFTGETRGTRKSLASAASLP